MAARRFLLTLTLLFSPSFLFSQQVKPVIDLAPADSLALKVKYKDDLNLLTDELTKTFPQQLLKVRAIFRWITENIGYDYKYFNKTFYRGRDPKTYRCNGDSADCELKRKVWETEYVNQVLSDKKAVCEGYAMLFKKMCQIAGIEAEMVPGYVRTEYYEIGTAGTLDHAWNAVKIDDQYYLVDATWAAGGCGKDDDGKLLSFHKYFNNYYWLTPPDEFARNHFPENAQWVLIPNYTKDKFAQNPYYAGGEISSIKVISPRTGIIAVKRGDTIHFKLEYTQVLHALQINTNIFRNPDTWYWDDPTKRKRVRIIDSAAIKKQQYVKFKQDDNTYEFAYIVKDRTLEYLDILFDTRRVIRFKVKF